MHIIFVNPQGNFDNNDSYWTMHPDFGGQLVYVKEIAIAMANLGHKVDIVTRYIDDPDFPEFRGEIDYYDGIKNLRIIRIKSKSNEFLTKELLWGHLDKWTYNIIDFYEKEGSYFDFMTGHYGDGGIACAMLKAKTTIPYSFTGHSLGAQKLDKLGTNMNNIEELDKKYHFTERILAERTAMYNSDLIFVSTEQERDEQYSHPLYKDITNNIQNPLKFVVSPPGANTTVFAPLAGDNISIGFSDVIENIISRDISDKRRNLPFIISASRLDSKKNHLGLVKAFAINKELNEKANLLISVRGIENAFDSYKNVSIDELEILDQIFKIINEYDLFGKITFISINSQTELADTYRYMTKRKSIFALTAMYEPFGLAPIEAMSTGLPAVVTKYGGPSDVLFEDGIEYGVLVDAFDETDIAKGLLKALNNYEFYKTQGMKRVKQKYTWEATAKKYLDAIVNLEETYKDVAINKFFEKPSQKHLDKSFLRNYLIRNN
ncbi:MAG: Mannosylfructose-phosphate synthase [Candidatus Izimaplasma bacterium HR2]|nr:MAG: Mannosylfructose-phosphate synthase [Candidatus Izimaplasma bacterium HR2]